MIVTKAEILNVLAQFNPWWRGEPLTDLPNWERAAFHLFFNWIQQPPAPRAVLLSGARQVEDHTHAASNKQVTAIRCGTRQPALCNL